MSVVILHKTSPDPQYGHTFVQTARSRSDRVGTYAEIIDASSDDGVDVVGAEQSAASIQQIIQERGYVEADPVSATGNERDVRRRLREHDPVFIHLVAVETSFVGGWEDWLGVALVDGSVPAEQPGYELDDGQSVSDVSLYEIETSMRDAVQLGKAQRSLEAAGGDTTLARAIQYVHPEVEAPISLFSRYIHADSEYALYRPSAIFQTTIAGLVSARGDIFDPDTHLPEAGITSK